MGVLRPQYCFPPLLWHISEMYNMVYLVYNTFCFLFLYHINTKQPLPCFRGAQVNRKDKDNYTPLLIASVKGNAETIDILLGMGADITICDKNDKTAIYLAAEENKIQALQVHNVPALRLSLLDVIFWTSCFAVSCAVFFFLN